MADADDVRRLALALPHVEEIDSDGFDFRVGGKGFVWSYPERTPGKPRVIRSDIAVLYVGDEAEKQAEYRRSWLLGCASRRCGSGCATSTAWTCRWRRFAAGWPRRCRRRPAARR